MKKEYDEAIDLKAVFKHLLSLPEKDAEKFIDKLIEAFGYPLLPQI